MLILYVHVHVCVLGVIHGRCEDVSASSGHVAATASVLGSL